MDIIHITGSFTFFGKSTWRIRLRSSSIRLRSVQAVRIWICMMVAHSCCGASAMIRRHRTVATGKDAGLLTPSWPDVWFSPKTACKEYWTYVSIHIKQNILMHILYGIWNPRCSNIVHLNLALLSWLRQKCVGSLRSLCISKNRIIRMLSASLSLSLTPVSTS